MSSSPHSKPLKFMVSVNSIKLKSKRFNDYLFFLDNTLDTTFSILFFSTSDALLFLFDANKELKRFEALPDKTGVALIGLAMIITYLVKRVGKINK